MKKILVVIMLLPFVALAQLENPTIKSQSLFIRKIIYIKNRNKPVVEVIKDIDADGIKDITISYWENGYWQAELKHYNSSETVFISDVCFVKNNRYMMELKKYTTKVPDDQLQNWKKKYGSKIANGLYYETPVIGMTATMVSMCIGDPSRTNNTETAYYYDSQWVYYNYDKTSAKYYYFRNGKLTTIQD
ncbi:hypothetical protein [Pedobacter alluvionis]|uniref:Uncharacterized protein n=1 Tax=Pedobacter alluvionis TaxID=475253 RepID=A0A497Y4Q5_9SPHI|nr:hypothetical protein [Pedobacter alluvionis]RLJ77140.1 hypothetical protein BCL90_2211 [Pedobacter alluvionis]TFB33622.1 hypothetical protein E3V97_06150 [Pedobacter alluvionis]